VVDQPRCRGCATCLPVCPHGAISLRSTYASSTPPSIS
jgi:Fe-S-cluster-containing hydrogenase component 2